MTRGHRRFFVNNIWLRGAREVELVSLGSSRQDESTDKHHDNFDPTCVTTCLWSQVKFCKLPFKVSWIWSARFEDREKHKDAKLIFLPTGKKLFWKSQFRKKKTNIFSLPISGVKRLTWPPIWMKNIPWFHQELWNVFFNRSLLVFEFSWGGRSSAPPPPGLAKVAQTPGRARIKTPQTPDVHCHWLAPSWTKGPLCSSASTANDSVPTTIGWEAARSLPLDSSFSAALRVKNSARVLEKRYPAATCSLHLSCAAALWARRPWKPPINRKSLF